MRSKDEFNYKEKFQQDFPGADEADGYSKLPKSLWTKDLGLSGHQVSVLIALQYFHRDDKKSQIFPSLETLAKLTGFKKTTISEALDDLVKTKGLKRHARGQGFIYDLPAFWTKFGVHQPRKKGIDPKAVVLTDTEVIANLERHIQTVKTYIAGLEIDLRVAKDTLRGLHSPSDLQIENAKLKAELEALRAGIPTVQPTPSVQPATTPTIPTTTPQIQPTIQSLSRHYDSIEEAMEALDKMAELTRIAELTRSAELAKYKPKATPEPRKVDLYNCMEILQNK